MYKRVLAAVLSMLLLTLSACGASAYRRDSAAETVTITDDLGRSVEVLARPGRVIPLTGSFADIWCLAGGADSIVAASGDAWTNFDLPLPADAADLGSVEDVELEAIIAAEPELILAAANMANDTNISKPSKNWATPFSTLRRILSPVNCDISVYLWREHPLASKRQIDVRGLMPYPCLSFDQGTDNSFYFAEEMLSTYPYRQVIKVSDRATMLNMMVGLNGYTLCSGIICEELNGELYKAIPLETEEKMTIGYIKKKQVPLSPIAERYIEELRAYMRSREAE